MKPPRTTTQYNALPERSKNSYNRARAALTQMRTREISLEEAAKEQGMSRRTLILYGNSGLQKLGRVWVPKKSDQLFRILKIPTPDGPREIGVRGSRKAAQVAEYWNAVHRYLETGDKSRLSKFEARFIRDANSAPIPFITDPKELKRLGSAGVLSFESLYARAT